MEPEYAKRAERVSHPFVIWYRQAVPIGGVPEEWNASTIRNISMSGILFCIKNQYEVGIELELKIFYNPTKPEAKLLAKVVRCNPSGRLKGFYEAAVSIIKVEEPSKSFYDAIEVLVGRKK